MSFRSVLAGNIVYRGLNMITGFLVMLLLTRLMSTAGFGILSLLIANVTFFNLVSCLGAESSAIYHSASQKLSQGKILTLIYGVFVFQLLLLVIVEVIMYTVTGSYWLFQGAAISNLLIGVVFLLVITLADKYTTLLYGLHQYTLANRVILFSNLMALAAFLYYYFNVPTKNTLFYLGIYVASITAQAILLAISYHIFSGVSVKFLRVNRQDLKTFFSYSFIVFVTNVIQFLAYRVDYWLVDHFKGASDLGVYALAIRLNQLTWAIPILAASIIFPMVSDQAKKYNEDKLLSLLRLINTSLFATSVMAWLLAPYIIPAWFGDAYAGSVEVFRWLVPGFYLFVITIILASWYAGKGKLLVNLYGSVFCFALVFVLDLWLIPKEGLKGAAIASSIAYGSTAIYYVTRFCGTYQRSPVEFFIMKRNDWHAIKEIS